ncbi:MAG: acylphosphatase [Candidatus Margulisiibacteriota bacterium]
MKRIHIIYSGRVHGVGFRFTAVDLAIKNNLTGWVKNTLDGKVEIVVEGEETELDQYLTAIESIMKIYIREKSIYCESATGEFVDFRIEY